MSDRMPDRIVRISEWIVRIDARRMPERMSE
jgi:hypothetical protein